MILIAELDKGLAIVPLLSRMDLSDIKDQQTICIACVICMQNNINRCSQKAELKHFPFMLECVCVHSDCNLRHI